METYEVLEKAQAKVEEGWCRGHFAQTVQGNVVSGNDPGAVRFCARGALHHVLNLDSFGRNGQMLPKERPYLDLLEKQLPSDFDGYGYKVADYSNKAGQEAIVEVFQKAVRAEKERLGIPIDIPAEQKEEVLV